MPSVRFSSSGGRFAPDPKLQSKATAEVAQARFFSSAGLPARAVKTTASKEKARIAPRARLPIRSRQRRRCRGATVVGPLGIAAWRPRELSSGVDSDSTNISLVLKQFSIATPEAAAGFAAPPRSPLGLGISLSKLRSYPARPRCN
jgi:hypothetical protein